MPDAIDQLIEDVLAGSPAPVSGSSAPQANYTPLPQQGFTPLSGGTLPATRAASDDPGVWGAFTRGVSNIDNRVMGTLGTLQEMAGGALGLEGVEQAGRAQRTRWDALRAPNPVQGLQDVRNAGDVGEVIAYLAPEEATSLGAQFGGMATGAGIGAGIGSVVPGPGTIAGAGIGSVVGGVTTNWGLNAADNYQAFLDDGMTEDEARFWAAVTAVPQAGLDLIMPARVARTVVSPQVVSTGVRAARHIMSRAGRGAVRGAAEEGLTEAAQEALQIGVGSGVTGDNILTEENAWQLANAALIGGVLGGGVSGVAGGVEGARTVGRAQDGQPGEAPEPVRDAEQPSGGEAPVPAQPEPEVPPFPAGEEVEYDFAGETRRGRVIGYDAIVDEDTGRSELSVRIENPEGPDLPPVDEAVAVLNLRRPARADVPTGFTRPDRMTDRDWAGVTFQAIATAFPESDTATRINAAEILSQSNTYTADDIARVMEAQRQFSERQTVPQETEEAAAQPAEAITPAPAETIEIPPEESAVEIAPAPLAAEEETAFAAAVTEESASDRAAFESALANEGRASRGGTEYVLEDRTESGQGWVVTRRTGNYAVELGGDPRGNGNAISEAINVAVRDAGWDPSIVPGTPVAVPQEEAAPGPDFTTTFPEPQDEALRAAGRAGFYDQIGNGERDPEALRAFHREASRELLDYRRTAETVSTALQTNRDPVTGLRPRGNAALRAARANWEAERTRAREGFGHAVAAYADYFGQDAALRWARYVNALPLDTPETADNAAPQQPDLSPVADLETPPAESPDTAETVAESPSEPDAQAPTAEDAPKRGRKMQDVGERMAGKRADISSKLKQVDDIEKAVNDVLDAMTPSAVVEWRWENPTSGLQLAGQGFTRAFLPFTEWAGKRAGGGRRRHQDGFREAIIGRARDSAARGDDEPFAELEGDVETYLNHVQTIVEAFDGISTVKDARHRAIEIRYRNHPDRLKKEWPGIEFRGIDQEQANELTDASTILRHGQFYDFVSITAGLEETSENTPGKRKVIRRFKNEEMTREGFPDRRQGNNIDERTLMETFGFRGVEFGNWVSSKEGQDRVNWAYEALHDLADTLGIPPKAIGLGGRLGLAFGSRGKGRHSAHYEPGNKVINLTKTNGDGSFTHEWAHALDFFLREAGLSQLPDDISWALQYKMDPDTVIRSLKNFAAGQVYYTNLPGSNGRKKPTVRDQLDYAITRLKHQTRNTDFLAQAYEIAGAKTEGQGRPYWAKPEELFARSFESWVFDTMAERDQTSNFAVNHYVAEGVVSRENGYKGAPYPRGDERADFADYWQRFMSALQFDEDGNLTNIENGIRYNSIRGEQQGAIRELLEGIDRDAFIAEANAERKQISAETRERADNANRRNEAAKAETDPQMKLARWAAVHLGIRHTSNTKIDNTELFNWARDTYGATENEGAFTPGDVYDALEMGVNLHILDLPGVYSPIGTPTIAKETLARLDSLVGILPNQTRRTGDKEAFQQFSTPPHYAFVANWVAAPSSSDVVLEPSAGMGGLAVFSRLAGADVVMNEIEPKRRGLLEKMGIGEVFGEDGEQIDNILPEEVRPSLVVMNPPFSNAGTRGVRGDSSITARHIDQAFKRLVDGGRLVVITGHNFHAGIQKHRAAFERWGKDGTIRASVSVDGAVYRKYGTTYDTRLIVIDKVPNPNPSAEAEVSGQFKTLSDVIDALEEIKNDRHTPDQPSSIERSVEGRSETTEAADRSGDDAPGDAAEVGTGEPSDRNGTDEGPRGRSGRDRGASEPGDSDGVARGRDRRGEDGATDGAAGAEAGRSDTSGGPSRADDDTPGISQSSGEFGQAVIVTPVETPRASRSVGDGAYDVYVPQRLRVEGAITHPTELVQSAAMAAVVPPVPTYAPAISLETVVNGRLSEAQMEAAIYAGAAHEKMLDASEEHPERRRGYFIGDGTGVGKGREISGIIMDNWNQGRRRHIWVSKNWDLLEDAKRDIEGVGMDPEIVTPLSKFKAGEPIDVNEGVLFVSYDTLKMEPKGKQTRLEQIAEWLGDGFDGVLVFDEAHIMANAVAGDMGKTASQVALAGLKIQDLLPMARVVYVSATAATEVANLSYASRLGLWGPGTAFPTRSTFISQIQAGGIAAMELVARDLKALGRYQARSLSFEGVEYARLEHKLTAEQRDIYDTLAKAWQSVLQNIDKALASTSADKNSRAKAAAYNAFWSSHQRFFNQVLTAMQMPTVIRQMEADLDAGMSPVLQLVNTNEAAQERAIAKLGEDDTLEDLDITPRDQLAQLIEKSFPIYSYEEYTDDGGNKRSRLVEDSAGNPVVDRAAKAMQEKLLTEVGSIRVPDGPLEIILDHFGIDQVAEVTGRSRRVVKKRGKRTIERLSKKFREAETDAFMNDKKKILFFSAAGGTGRSYHADLNAKNQRRRSHYLLQPGWSAAPAIQGFGRTHRTNQASQPLYRLVTTDAKGQKRFVSSIARRLDQLGALTKGQRQTGGQGLFTSTDNLESDYARDAVRSFIVDAMAGAIPGIDRNTLTQDMGLKIENSGNKTRKDSGIPDVPKFLNRVLSLTLEKQDLVFDAFEARMNELVARAEANGELDLGVEFLKADHASIDSRQTVHVDEETGAQTDYVQVRTQTKARTFAWEDVKPGKKIFGNPVTGHYIQKRSGRVYAMTKSRTTTTASGMLIDTFRRAAPNGSSTIIEEPELRSKYEEIQPDEAKKLWEKEHEQAPRFNTDTVHMISGALLPIWDRLPSDQPRVVRINLDEGGSILGRVIPPEELKSTLSKLGAEAQAIQMSPQDVFNAVLSEGKTVTFANDWKLKRRSVSGQARVELVGPTSLGGMPAGVVSERIDYTTRYFVPQNEDGAAYIERQKAAAPIITVSDPKKSADDEYSTRQYSAPFARALPEIKAEIQRIVSMANPKVSVKFADQLFGEGPGLLASGASSATRMEVAGIYRQSEALVEISLDQSKFDPINTAHHELFHSLQDMLTPEEVRAIARQYPATGMSPKEAAAVGYAEWAQSAGNPLPPVRRAFSKIRNFFRALGNLLRGLGFTTAEQIFADIKYGDIAARAGEATDTSQDPMDDPWRAIEEATGWVPNSDEAYSLVSRDFKETIRKVTGGPTAASEGVAVEREEAAKDLAFFKRYLWTPQAILREYEPRLARIHDLGTKLMNEQSNWTNRFQGLLSEAVKPLSEEEFSEMSGILWGGDALGMEFSGEDLSRGYTEIDGKKHWFVADGKVPSAKARKAYLETRDIIERIGRMVDQHERKMKAYYRQAKVALISGMARYRQMSEDEFRGLVQKALELHSKIRRADYATATDTPVETLQEQLAETEKQIFGRLGEEADTKEAEAFFKSYVDLLEIETKLQRTSVRRRPGYMPHKFFGSFGVYEVKSEQAIDENGNPVVGKDGEPEMEEYYDLVPGMSDPTLFERYLGGKKVQVQGFWDSRDNAVRAANAHMEKNPDARVVVRPAAMRFSSNAYATTLSDASYARFMKNMGDAFEMEMEEVRDLTSDIARRRARRRFAGFKQYRKGVQGYSQDALRVLEAHIGEAMRYIAMDELKYKSVTVVERAGLSPMRRASQERPVLAEMVEAWLRDVNGTKQPFEESVDQLFKKEWATPLRLGAGVGFSSFLLMGGVAGNPLLGALAGSYFGYRAYYAAARNSENPSRAFTGALLNDMAHLKLGMFFNIFSPLVNLSQTVINTYPVLGEKWTMVGIERYLAAVRSGRNAREVDPAKWTRAHRDFIKLQRANVNTAFRHSDQTPNLFEKEGPLSKISMYWFQNAESFNRGVMYLGTWAKEESAGKSPAAAKSAAERNMNRTQFDYSNMNKPEALRNTFARVPLQFKNFIAQQMAFIFSLDPKTELPRFLAAVFLMAGSLGLPLIDLLDELIKALFGEEWSPINAIKRQALLAQARGDLSAPVMQVVARGLPALIGVDISTRAGVGEKFLPLRLREFQGPWFSTLETARRYGETNATFIDYVRALSSGVGAPLKMLESFNNGVPLAYSVARGDIDETIARMTDGRIIYTNPWQRGRIEYEPDVVESVLRSVGGTPIREARMRDARDLPRVSQDSLIRNQQRVLDDIVLAVRTGDQARVREVLAEARRNGIRVSRDQIRYALEQAQLPRMARAVQNARREIRPEVLRLQEGVE